MSIGLERSVSSPGYVKENDDALRTGVTGRRSGTIFELDIGSLLAWRR